jgi:ATP-dependent Clp protease ATP-binding subunit ClpX
LIEGTQCKISINGGRKNNSDTVEIDTTNILFIAGGAFVGLDKIIKNRVQGTSIGFSANTATTSDNTENVVTADDLVRYGMIPEFVGRFSSVVTLNDLTKDQLIDILTMVKNNFVDQYKWLFEQDGVELEFDQESLNLIAERTLTTKTGARGLHSELERILTCHMFNLPRYKKANILKVAINKTQVNTPMTLSQENL